MDKVKQRQQHKKKETYFHQVVTKNRKFITLNSKPRLEATKFSKYESNKSCRERENVRTSAQEDKVDGGIDAG